MAALQNINLNGLIRHISLVKPADIFVDYATFAAQHSPIELFHDPRTGLARNVTNEIHRKFWSTLSCLCNDVRENGYTLSAESLDVNNLVVVGGNRIKLRNLIGTQGVVMGDNKDFVAVSNFIAASIANEPLYLPSEDDTYVLIVHLRTVGGDFDPAINFVRLKCHTSLMTNAIKKSFCVSMIDNSGVGTRGYQIWDHGNELYPKQAWVPLVLALPANCSLIQILNFGNPTHYPTLRSFIRNCLVHLVIDHGYSHGRAMSTIICLFPDYFMTFQFRLLISNNITDDELLDHTPPTN